MDTTAVELAAFRERISAAEACIEKQDWEAARQALEAAIAIDALQPKPFDLMAGVLAKQQRGDEAEQFRARAKVLRQEQWQRQVEAEIRGQHELIGGPARHEIP
jgi:Tfp pilus assembly protein PilF